MKNKYMNKKQKEKWAEVRAKGRKRYILVNGILIMGGTFAILMPVFSQVIRLLRFYWFNTPYVSIDSTRDVFGYVADVFGYVIAGVLFGWLMGRMNWSATERAYRESEDD